MIKLLYLVFKSPLTIIVLKTHIVTNNKRFWLIDSVGLCDSYT